MIHFKNNSFDKESKVVDSLMYINIYHEPVSVCKVAKYILSTCYCSIDSTHDHEDKIYFDTLQLIKQKRTPKEMEQILSTHIHSNVFDELLDPSSEMTTDIGAA